MRAASKYCDTYLRRREAQQFCLFLFISGSLVLFFLSRLACFVALRYAVGYPMFRLVWGIFHVPSSIMPRACLFSGGATVHPKFRPVRMSPPPSCPEIASLVELRRTPCFDRLGDFPCHLCPHALSLLVSRRYTTYTTPPVSTGSGICPFSMP